jgi:uncharacterized protein (DUF885 family)
MNNENDLQAVEVLDNSKMTKDQLITLLVTKTKAIEQLETIRLNQDEQIRNVNEMASKEIRTLQGMLTNTVKYTKKKEDAILKIMQGMTDLMFLDREQINPTEEK